MRCALTLAWKLSGNVPLTDVRQYLVQNLKICS